MTSAGAMPKETASASESSWAPKSDPVRVNRATRPSRRSRVAAKTRNHAAQEKSPLSAATIA